MARHYAVVKQEERWSKHGGKVIEVTMVGLDDRQEYTTWIDPLNMNAKNWTHITRTPEHGFILTGLKNKRVQDRDDVINADSKPIIAQEHPDRDEMLSVIMEHWQAQDLKRRKPAFDDFFQGPDA